MGECKKKMGPAAWAVGMSADENGELLWYVYCSNKKKLKKAPKEFDGRPVRAIFLEAPNYKGNGA